MTNRMTEEQTDRNSMTEILPKKQTDRPEDHLNVLQSRATRDRKENRNFPFFPFRRLQKEKEKKKEKTREKKKKVIAFSNLTLTEIDLRTMTN